MSNAWLLIGASTAACVCGSLVIYFDVLWNTLTCRPKKGPNEEDEEGKSHGLVFQDNNQVLIVSMSLSSGVLLLTSMYSLLPEAREYFEQSPTLKGSPKLATTILFITYLSGVVLCAIFNFLIHAFTSKSIVHCAHDHADEENNEYQDFYNYDHSHRSNEIAHENTPPQRKDTSAHHNTQSIHDENLSPDSDENAETIVDETSALLPIDAKSAVSHSPNAAGHTTKLNILDRTYSRIKSKELVGKCMGYSDAGKCVHQRVIEPVHTSDGKLGLHVCDEICRLGDEPQSPDSHHQHHHQHHAHQHHAHHHNHAHSHLHHNHGHTNDESAINAASSYHTCGPSAHSQYNNSAHAGSISDAASHTHSSDDVEEHHHHVVSPYSRVLSIGLQTALAITIHKIPEGFVTFATYKENPRLGLSVFTALAVHNFAEGFSIAFPLYLSLRKRFAAFAIAALLGGLSQPLGAGIAQLFFRKKFANGDGLPAFTFGILISFTAGFMSIIGLQMYGTGVAFGGKQYVTLPCAFLGVAIVGLSTVLTGQ